MKHAPIFSEIPIPKMKWNREDTDGLMISTDLAETHGDKTVVIREKEKARRAGFLAMGLIDPHGKDLVLSLALAPIIVGRASKEDKSLAESILLNALEKYGANELDELFKRILELKKNYEGLRHRNWYALSAFHQYIEETGKNPSKRTLRLHMMENRKSFKDQPAPDDKKGWTRLWKESGIDGMLDR